MNFACHLKAVLLLTAAISMASSPLFPLLPDRYSLAYAQETGRHGHLGGDIKADLTPEQRHVHQQ